MRPRKTKKYLIQTSICLNLLILLKIQGASLHAGPEYLFIILALKNTFLKIFSSNLPNFGCLFHDKFNYIMTGAITSHNPLPSKTEIYDS